MVRGGFFLSSETQLKRKNDRFVTGSKRSLGSWKKQESGKVGKPEFWGAGCRVAQAGGGENSYYLGSVRAHTWEDGTVSYYPAPMPQSGRLENSYPDLMFFAAARLIKPILKLDKILRNANAATTTKYTYDPRLAGQTDLYHSFPRSFDQTIIEFGAPAQRISDKSFFYQMEGMINGTPGMYEIIVSPGGNIFHRAFKPF